jgi:uncharacterized cofD-like protein
MESIFEGGKLAPRITCIGGGTGLSTMLRGLKRYSPNITAIVTVTDDGGGSGVLRDELGMPPPGDIRNCIQALSNAEPTMEKLMSYRFPSGSLQGQCFGNLLLAAMNGISESFDKAVARMGEVLAITGRVMPVTNADVRLAAEFEDGSLVFGESRISEAKKEHGCRIKKVQIVPSFARALPESLQAIAEADMIIIGPGSLYTSLIPNLLVGGIVKAIEASAAVKLFVCNIMTQPGETEGYTAADHIRGIYQHSADHLFDTCLVNDAPLPEEVRQRYAEDGAVPITVNAKETDALGVKIICAPLADYTGGLVRHNSELLAREIMKIYTENAPTRLYGGGKTT